MGGTSTLGDAELLAVLLADPVGEACALELATAVLRDATGIGPASRSTVHELASVHGIQPAQAIRIASAFELGRRALLAAQRRPTITRPVDLFQILAPRFVGLTQERFIVVGIDVRSSVIDIVEVARGSVAGVEVFPREVFRPLVRMAALGAVLAHNHPSGDPTPSEDDLALTRRLVEIGQLVGIPIIDHLVIGGRSFRALSEVAPLAISSAR